MNFHTNIEFKGHFFDSLILPKILDTAMENDTQCVIKQIEIGNSREQESYIRIKIFSDSQDKFENTLKALEILGGNPIAVFEKRIEIKGHIIDSLTLPKILDIIVKGGGRCLVEKINVGMEKNSFSYAKIKILAPNEEILATILEKTEKNGAIQV